MNKMSAKLGALSLMAGMFAHMGGESLFPSSVRKLLKERVGKKCSLPGCENMSYHNGGYCCAEHSREAKRLDKERRSATHRVTNAMPSSGNTATIQ